MSDNIEAIKVVIDSQGAKELEKLYELYFTPPLETNTQLVMFEQTFEEVSLFDYSMSTYATDSVTPCKVSYA